MTNKEQLIYLAGLLDGEGCLYYTHQIYKNSHYYYPRINITNTHKLTLNWIKLLFGGTIRNDHRSDNNPKHKQRWRWIINCQDAVKLIKCLLPYLKIKKNEAKLFVQSYDGDNNFKKNLYKKIQKLRKIKGDK